MTGQRVDWSSLPQGNLHIVVYAVDGSGYNPVIYDRNVTNPYRAIYDYKTISIQWNKLIKEARNYREENGLSIDPDLYALQYIRSRNAGYTKGNWTKAMGDVDPKFVDYIYNKDVSLYYYFQSSIYMPDTKENNQIDFVHFAAVLNGIYYDTPYSDAGIESFDEVEINRLCGWAGDLQQEECQVIQDTVYSDDYQICYNKASQLIGAPSGVKSDFGISDVLADVDAVNIAANVMALNSNSSMADKFAAYYGGNFNNKRFTTFLSTNDFLMPERYTQKYAFNSLGRKVEWPLLNGFNPTANQSKAVACAFSDYLHREASYEH